MASGRCQGDDQSHGPPHSPDPLQAVPPPEKVIRKLFPGTEELKSGWCGFSHLPGPVPAVLAVDHLLSPGALAARLQVVRVAQVPRLVVEVDVHLVKS